MNSNYGAIKLPWFQKIQMCREAVFVYLTKIMSYLYNGLSQGMTSSKSQQSRRLCLIDKLEADNSQGHHSHSCTN
jgi:hypothetical protein